jgi:hypothetical protein
MTPPAERWRIARHVIECIVEFVQSARPRNGSRDVGSNMKNAATLSRAGSADLPTRLDLAERLFIWVFRLIVQHRRCSRPTMVEIHRACGQFKIEDAIPLLGALVDTFACNAHSAIEVHSPDRLCVSDGEMGLLRAMTAAQSGKTDVARCIFERWLPVLAADRILSPVSAVGQTFQAKGLLFGRRDIIVKRRRPRRKSGRPIHTVH